MSYEDFSKCRVEIKMQYEVYKDYEKAICLLKRLLIKLMNSKEELLPYCWWYTYYDLGYCYKKLNKYKTSKMYLKQSIKFISDNEDPNYCKSLWLLANNYKELGDTKKSKEYYIMLSKIYKQINKKANRMFMLMNLAWVNDNLAQLLRMVKVFIQIDENELQNNANVYIDQIIPSIIADAQSIKNKNDIAYANIINILRSADSPMIRQKLFTLICE